MAMLDADGLPDDTPMALMRGCAEDETPAGADQEHPFDLRGKRGEVLADPMDPQTMRALMRDMEKKWRP